MKNKYTKIIRYIKNNIIKSFILLVLLSSLSLIVFDIVNETNTNTKTNNIIQKNHISIKVSDEENLEKYIYNNKKISNVIFYNNQENKNIIKFKYGEKQIEFKNLTNISSYQILQEMKNNSISFKEIQDFKNTIIEKKWYEKIGYSIEKFIRIISPFFYLLFGTVIFGFLIYIIKIYVIDRVKFKKYNIIMPEDNIRTLDELKGLEEIKKEILQLKDMFKNKEIYERNGIKDKFNIIFSGPAGTGKTHFASALAKELQIPLVAASGADMVSMYQGSGSSFIKGFFKEARNIMDKYNTSVIMFLDEGQDILKDRNEFKGFNIEERTGPINQLLQELDGVYSYKYKKSGNTIIFIVASNFNETTMNMDEAILRRFSKKIQFRKPNLNERKLILEYLFEKVDKKYLKGL